MDRIKTILKLANFTLIALLSCAPLIAFCQSTPHAPTSATDLEVKIHEKKKGVFKGKSRIKKRVTEREGQALQSTRFKPQIRNSERHGKPLPKNKIRNRNRNWTESRVYQRHASSTGKEGGVRSRNRSTRRPQ